MQPASSEVLLHPALSKGIGMAMLLALVQNPALWGFAGAFIYAAPRLTVCIFAAQQEQGHWFQCAFEFGMALAIGGVAAAVFGPWIGSSILRATDPAQTRVITATIGLLANPISPRVIDVLSGRVLNILKGSDK